MGTEEANNYVNEMNAMALAANLADLREKYDAKFAALENEVAVMKDILSKQQRVLGEALAMAYGKGSTVQE